MREKILEILREVNEEILEYEGEAMAQDGVISSFDIISIIAEIDDQLGIEIKPESIVPANFANKEAIIAMVEKYQ